MDDPTKKEARPSDMVGTTALDRLLRAGNSFSGGEQNCVHLNDKTGNFVNISAISGLDFPDDARGLATIDWDFDGDLDLWFSNRTAPRVRLMRNELNRGQDHHFVALKLVGTRSNRDAVGARVSVFVEGRDKPFLASRVSADAFLSQPSAWVHVGLGTASQVHRLEIRWPNGETQSFDKLDADRFYKITEGDDKVTVWTPPEATPLTPEPQEELPVESKARIFLFQPFPTPILQIADGASGKRRIDAVSRPTLLLFWASWCAPCIEEMKALVAEKSRIESAGLDILALSVDGVGEDAQTGPKEAEEALKTLGWPYQNGFANVTVLDKLELVQDIIFELRQPSGVPFSVLLNAKGEIAAIYRGKSQVDQLVSDVAALGLQGSARKRHGAPFSGRWIGEPQRWSYKTLADEFEYRSPEDDARYLGLAIEQMEAEIAGSVNSQEIEQKREEIAVLQSTRAKVLLELGNQSEAQELLNKSESLGGDSYDKLMAEGDRYLDDDDPVRALQSYDAASRIKPELAAPKLRMVQTLVAQDRLTEAVAMATAALTLNPVNGDADAILADVLTESGEFDQAIAVAQKALQKHNQHGGLYGALGKALGGKGDLGSATKALTEAVRYNPKDGELHRALGVAYAQQNRFDLAVEAFRASVIADPDNHVAWSDLAMTYSAMGRDKEMVATIEDLHKRVPDDLETMTRLAWIRATHPDPALRNPEQALKLAEKAVALTGSQNPYALDSLAVALARSGRYAEAQARALRAIELATQAGGTKLAQSIEGRLALFKAEQPYTDQKK